MRRQNLVSTGVVVVVAAAAAAVVMMMIIIIIICTFVSCRNVVTSEAAPVTV